MDLRLALFAACAFFASSVSACVNTYEFHIFAKMHKPDPRQMEAAIAGLEEAQRNNPSYKTANDLGAAYILAGNYAKAIQVLRALEQKYPGLYMTASNLGTALELSGANKEALRWIKEGFRRDPNHHEGTEWLHVKVLESKIALEQDPAWLHNHSIIGVDFGADARPRTPAELPKDHLGQTRSLEETRKAIDHQLQERLKFVTPPDAVVADLYFSWGNLAFLRNSERDWPADEQYKAALMFGSPHAALIELRTKQYREDLLSRRPQPQPKSTWVLSLWIVIPALLFAGWYLMNRRRLNAERPRNAA